MHFDVAKNPQPQVVQVLHLQPGAAGSNERSEVHPSQVTNKRKTRLRRGGFFVGEMRSSLMHFDVAKNPQPQVVQVLHLQLRAAGFNERSEVHPSQGLLNTKRHPVGCLFSSYELFLIAVTASQFTGIRTGPFKQF